MRRSAFRAFVLVTACGAALTSARAGRADEIVACVSASEQAQVLRDEGKYLQARDKLHVCVRDSCPAIVKKDCAQWLAEVEANMPSIVVQARDGSGADLMNVTVTVDGAPFAERVDGKPLPIDPGEHSIRFEAAGLPPLERTIIMHAGERNRTLAVTLESDAPHAETSTRRVAAYVLGGVGAAALGGFGYLWFTGKSDVDDLRSTCAGSCDPSKVDAARTKLVVADVSLGVGVVALGVAGVLFFMDKSPGKSPTSAALVLDARPLPGGAATTIGGRF